MNDKRIKRKVLGVQFYIEELIYIVKIWFRYYIFRVIYNRQEPKKYFFEYLKENQKYKQICFNTENKLHTERYNIFHKKLFKYMKKPYEYFQAFPNKSGNYKINESQRFFPNKPPIKVTQIDKCVFYEGIEFNNMVFNIPNIEQVCFHNCSFRNCTFDNIIFLDYSKAIYEDKLEYYQGFSYCNFYHVNFNYCEFNHAFFSMCKLDLVEFNNCLFCNSILHRMSFNKVTFKGESILNNTNIFQPRESFDILFQGNVEDFHVDTNCNVTEFHFYDRIFINIEKYKWLKLNKSGAYSKAANTFFAIQQIWSANHIREADKDFANFYYQRKKAETRSSTKRSKFFGYLTEFVIGYGEKPFNALISMGILIFIFSILFLFTGFQPDSTTIPIQYSITAPWEPISFLIYDWGQSLYYSFFTLITVGQGSACPASVLTQFTVSVELLLGAILMTLFTATLFRKYTK